MSRNFNFSQAANNGITVLPDLTVLPNPSDLLVVKSVSPGLVDLGFASAALSSGAVAMISDTAPAGAPASSLWWDSTGTGLYIRYNDGSSTQWVSTENQAAIGTVKIADNPPTAADNSLWWDSSGTGLYVRYNDGNSTQWVAAQNPYTLTDSPHDGNTYARQSGNWVNLATAPGMPFLPITGGCMTGAFTSVTGAAMAPFIATDIYQNPNSWALSGGSMTVRGQPYGYYDTGTLLSLVSTTLPLSSSRAGINGGFEAGVPAIAGYGILDQVTLYASSVASPPPLVLHNVTYDATHVYPHPSLTSAQMAVLRKNMWVLTNSIDTTVSTTPSVPNGYKPETHYGSYVTGWATDGTSITVVGWTVPGSGHTAAGQVPPVGTLDAGAANATAYFGSPTANMGANIVLQHNPTTQPDDRGKVYTGIEIDIQNYGITDYQAFVGGITMNYNPINGAKCTADSAGIVVSGFPVAFAGQALNVLSAASPANWAGTPITNLTWEAQNYIDGDVLRLQCWTSRDSATGFAGSASVHLGLGINGTPLSLAGVTRQAQIVWNPQGFSGGLQLQNAAGTAALSIDNSATVTLHGELLGTTTAAYLQTVYAEGSARGGFVGSIQSAGTTPEVMGFWAQDGVLHLGIGSGDIPGTPNSTIATINSNGGLTISTIVLSVLPTNAVNDAAAAAAGVPVGAMYRNGSVLMVRVV